MNGEQIGNLGYIFGKIIIAFIFIYFGVKWILKGLKKKK